VTLGVLLHVPMFLMDPSTHYRLAGMPIVTDMLTGMGRIVVGSAAPEYGLLPRRPAGSIADEEIAALQDAPLAHPHWIQIIVLATALVINVMKAATLGPPVWHRASCPLSILMLALLWYCSTERATSRQSAST
jgi:putative MFS transporter